MLTNKWNSLLALGLLLGLLLACSASTANIGSLKVATDEEGKNEAKSFKPGDKVYAVAQIANNGGKVQAKFRILFDDVEGEKAGTLVQGAEKTLDVEGTRPAIFWITLPAAGFHNGRYKVEVNMLNEAGEQKDQKTATFDVAGYEKETKAAEPEKSEEKDK
jgi:hypothetical protein